MSDPTRKRLLEKTFRYTKSGETDIAATFKRIKKQLAKDAEAAKAIQTAANVKPLKAPVPIKRKEA